MPSSPDFRICRLHSLWLVAILAATATATATAAPPPPRLTVGDPEPGLEVEAFLKGDPVGAFQTDHVTVVEFWATWCAPCIYGMPRLTALQAQWADELTVIGVDVMELPYTDETRGRVTDFVKEHDTTMGYRVAYDGDAQRAVAAWLTAAGLNSIPNAFVVDGNGRIAHIGNPLAPEFDQIVAAVIAGDHDLTAAHVAYETGRERAKTEAAAKKIARDRLDVAVATALPLIQAGRFAEGVACLDTLDGVFEALGADARDQAKVVVCRRLFAAGDLDTAHAWMDHLLAADAMTSPLQLNEVAWIIANPDAPVPGADPARGVKFCERALERLSPDLEMVHSMILDVQARCLWLAGARERAIAVQTRAVQLEPNERMKALLQALLDEYSK